MRNIMRIYHTAEAVEENKKETGVKYERIFKSIRNTQSA